jgi:hypothetical protein
VALTDAEHEALDRLVVYPSGVIFDPTVARACVKPLAELVGVAAEDVLTYGRVRGWDEATAGRVVGAIELFRTLTHTGVLPRDPYPGNE